MHQKKASWTPEQGRATSGTWSQPFKSRVCCYTWWGLRGVDWCLYYHKWLLAAVSDGAADFTTWHSCPANLSCHASASTWWSHWKRNLSSATVQLWAFSNLWYRRSSSCPSDCRSVLVWSVIKHHVLFVSCPLKRFTVFLHDHGIVPPDRRRTFSCTVTYFSMYVQKFVQCPPFSIVLLSVHALLNSHDIPELKIGPRMSQMSENPLRSLSPLFHLLDEIAF